MINDKCALKGFEKIFIYLLKVDHRYKFRLKIVNLLKKYNDHF